MIKSQRSSVPEWREAAHSSIDSKTKIV